MPFAVEVPCFGTALRKLMADIWWELEELRVSAVPCGSVTMYRSYHNVQQPDYQGLKLYRYCFTSAFQSPYKMSLAANTSLNLNRERILESIVPALLSQQSRQGATIHFAEELRIFVPLTLSLPHHPYRIINSVSSFIVSSVPSFQTLLWDLLGPLLWSLLSLLHVL